MVDQGLIIFIKQKLELRISLEKISASLQKAGFTEKQIAEGIKEVKRLYKDTHQDILASTDFLPVLAKAPQEKKNVIESYHQSHGGQLFDGRIRRSDFILGFLFFFGLGIVAVTAVVSVLYACAPEVYQAALTFVSNSTDGAWLILLPVLLTPITLMILSLSARRLHDMDLPGTFSLVFLSFFIPTTNLFHPSELIGLYIVAAILFILMITRKGNKNANRYGAARGQKGSFFRRLLTID